MVEGQLVQLKHVEFRGNYTLCFKQKIECVLCSMNMNLTCRKMHNIGKASV